MDEHSKEIMSGTLSTPRDKKVKKNGENNHRPVDENNRRLSYNNDFQRVQTGENNHPKFLTPSDITRQYEFSKSNADSNNNHSMFQNLGENNHHSSYQYQGESNHQTNQIFQKDENNRQYYYSGDTNHQQKYNRSYKFSSSHDNNIRHTGNNNCQNLSHGDNNHQRRTRYGNSQEYQNRNFNVVELKHHNYMEYDDSQIAPVSDENNHLKMAPKDP